MNYLESFRDHDFMPAIDNLEVDDYEQANQQDICAMSWELEALKESINQNPARPYIALIAKNGAGKGDIGILTTKQYRILTGAKWLSFTMKQGTKKLVRHALSGGEFANSGCKRKGQITWEYALDQTARDRGYEDGEQFRDAIISVKADIDRVKELERKV